MRARCNNPNNRRYGKYGGIGIAVCEEWSDFWVFARWCEDNGLDRKDYRKQVHRKNKLGNYSPDNCVIVETIQEHATIDAQKYQAFGEIKTMREWSEDPRCQVKYTTLTIRAKRMPLEEAITRKWHKGSGAKAKTHKLFGENKTMEEWSRDPRCIDSVQLMRSRVHIGWSVEDAMTRPVRRCSR